MRFSQLNWRYQLLALALFIVAMLAIVAILRWLVYDALPEWLAIGLGLIAIGFSIGSFVGEWIAKRSASRPPTHYWPDKEY